MQNQIELLLNNYHLTHLIDPNQVRLDLDTQNTNDYAMIQAIFNDQIEQATQQRDWQRVIDLLKAMVEVSQNVGNYDDTIIAEISLLYLTFSRYYNTDLLQAEINPVLMRLQVITQQADTNYETLDALIQNVTANLTVPNNLPLDLNPAQALHNLIQQTPANNRNETADQSQTKTAADLPSNAASLDETMTALNQEKAQSRQNKNQRVAPEPADADITDYDDDDDQDSYVPLYKKWWFWTLLVLIILIIAIIIKLVVTKVTTPSVSSEPQTEKVADSKSQADLKKKTNLDLQL